jgi:hypothetical protein
MRSGGIAIITVTTTEVSRKSAKAPRFGAGLFV